MLHRIIMILIVDGLNLCFLTQECVARRVDANAVYELIESPCNSYKFIKADSLLDRYPLNDYSGFVVLKHSLRDE